MSQPQDKTKQSVQTTGHAWDGDLQEFNNPLPNWWLWSFYATVVFAVIYWILYPAWPMGDSYTKGVLNDITYTTEDGRTVETHWNTRALLEKDLQKARAERAPYIEQVGEASFQHIKQDVQLSAFANSTAKVLFADNCAACHQRGGAGLIGKYPNLADDSWLWGGDFQQIENTIRHGHHGFMPSFAKALNNQQLDQLSSYVLSLSGHQVDPAKASAGKAIFNGQVGGCYQCHTKQGTGRTSLGSANLTDAIWTIADVNGAPTLKEKKARIEQVIRNGVQRQMPAWQGRLSDNEIRMLTFYVHELGGGS
jgi:cytochrome c oxidase cbb3-type subunit 3